MGLTELGWKQTVVSPKIGVQGAQRHLACSAMSGQESVKGVTSPAQVEGVTDQPHKRRFVYDKAAVRIEKSKKACAVKG